MSLTAAIKMHHVFLNLFCLIPFLCIIKSSVLLTCLSTTILAIFFAPCYRCCSLLPSSYCFTKKGKDKGDGDADGMDGEDVEFDKRQQSGAGLSLGSLEQQLSDAASARARLQSELKTCQATIAELNQTLRQVQKTADDRQVDKLL